MRIFKREMLSNYEKTYGFRSQLWLRFIDNFAVWTVSNAQFSDTYREKAPSNKTAALTISVNMNISVLGISNQLLIRGSYSDTKFSLK